MPERSRLQLPAGVLPAGVLPFLKSSRISTFASVGRRNSIGWPLAWHGSDHGNHFGKGSRAGSFGARLDGHDRVVRDGGGEFNSDSRSFGPLGPHQLQS